MSRIYLPNGELAGRPRGWDEFLNGREPTVQLAVDYLESGPVNWGKAIVDALLVIDERLAAIEGDVFIADVTVGPDPD